MAQAARYGRLARELDSRGDAAFLRSMEAGYRAKAEQEESANDPMNGRPDGVTG